MEDESMTAVLVLFLFSKFFAATTYICGFGTAEEPCRGVRVVLYSFATDSSVLQSRGQSFVFLFTFSIAQLIRRLRCDESLQQVMEKSNCCYALDFSCHHYLWTVFEQLITIVNNFKGKLFRFLLWLIVAKQFIMVAEAHRIIACILSIPIY